MERKATDLYQFSITKNLENGSVELSFFGRKCYTMKTKEDVEILINALSHSIHE
jgi:hypothetical protein